MTEKRFIVLETVEVMSIEQGCVYIEKTSFGAVVIVNLFNFENNKDYLISLTDADGHNYTQKFNSNYISFSLGGFIVDDDIYVEIYKNSELVLKGYSEFNTINKNVRDSLSSNDNFYDNRLSANEYAKETNQTEILNEACAILDKYKNLMGGVEDIKQNDSKNIKIEDNYSVLQENDFDCDVKTENSNNEEELTLNKELSETFYDQIKEEFELLYSSGTDFPLLSDRFGGSWKRVSAGETIMLAKFYNKPKFLLNSKPMPDIVALAIPIILSNSPKKLGANSVIFKVDTYGDFAYNILFQYAKDGRAIKINCN